MWAAIYGVAQSRTPLKRLSNSSSSSNYLQYLCESKTHRNWQVNKKQRHHLVDLKCKSHRPILQEFWQSKCRMGPGICILSKHLGSGRGRQFRKKATWRSTLFCKMRTFLIFPLSASASTGAGCENEARCFHIPSLIFQNLQHEGLERNKAEWRITLMGLVSR